MSDPTAYGQPDHTASNLYEPAFDYADNGGVHTNSGVANKTAYLIVDGTTAEPGGTFNGQSFAGIGPDKTAVLYWTVMRTLTPGSDFADLAAVLTPVLRQPGRDRGRGHLRGGLRHGAGGHDGHRTDPVGGAVGAAQRHLRGRRALGAADLGPPRVAGVLAAELLRRAGPPGRAGQRLRARRAGRAVGGRRRADPGPRLRDRPGGGDVGRHLPGGGPRPSPGRSCGWTGRRERPTAPACACTAGSSTPTATVWPAAPSTSCAGRGPAAAGRPSRRTPPGRRGPSSCRRGRRAPRPTRSSTTAPAASSATAPRPTCCRSGSGSA